MSILRDFERRLEGLVEGTFARAFRGGLQPVELAKRVLREMDAGKTVGVNEIWAPNHFVFLLSPADHSRFAGAEQTVSEELATVVRTRASERGWGLVGPPEFAYTVDEDLGKGRLKCEATLVAGEDRIVPSATATGSMTAAAAPRGGVVSLLILEPGKPGRTVRVSKDAVTLGRLPECDVVIADPGASRRHAQIRLLDGGYVVSDLGSTNGTLVNDRPVDSHQLADGDRITIGTTVVEFRGGA